MVVGYKTASFLQFRIRTLPSFLSSLLYTIARETPFPVARRSSYLAFPAALTTMHKQDQIHAESLNFPNEFWGHQASLLEWSVPPTSTLKITKGSSGEKKWEWFSGGKISTTHNMLMRHVQSGRGDQTAIIWDSPVTNTHNVRITYSQLLEDVQVLAGVLRGMGVQKGSRVLIYMPMIPAALTAILATVHLGAIHSVVFGGFAPAECAKRIASCNPEVIVTASCGIEGGTGKRRVIPYVPMVRKAVELSGIKKNGGCKVLAWQRKEYVEKLEEGEREYQAAVAGVRNRWKRGVNTNSEETQVLGYQAEGKKIEGVGRITKKTEPLAPRITSTITTRKELPEEQWVPVIDGVPVDSNDPIYLIYTSGTTDLPKGVVRDAGGNAVGLNFQMQHLYGINPGDVIFTASDIGWVVGHSYIIYAPLLCGATTVLFEGKPVGTPSADTFWRMVEEYKINVLSTAPTALRAIRREDPHGDVYFKKRDLRSLRGLFLAGERSEGSIVVEFQRLLDQYAAPGARVVDNWWSSESGSPITGIALGIKDNTVKIKPGSAGKQMPGWDVRVVGDDGEELPRGQMGNIVLGMPLSPTGFRTLWQEEARFKKGYLEKFNGKWIDTGDAGLIDDEGYVHIMSRTDDIINVAAHRFSTGAIEQVIVSHPMVAECCVVGMPDTLKGHVPFAFITLTTDALASVNEEKLYKEVNALVRDQIGAIASLGGVISGKRIIPKTRSGKSLRRVLRELVENASKGAFDKEPTVPATVEDMEVVGLVKDAVKKHFNKTAKSKL